MSFCGGCGDINDFASAVCEGCGRALLPVVPKRRRAQKAPNPPLLTFRGGNCIEWYPEPYCDSCGANLTKEVSFA